MCAILRAVASLAAVALLGLCLIGLSVDLTGLVDVIRDVPMVDVIRAASATALGAAVISALGLELQG